MINNFLKKVKRRIRRLFIKNARLSYAQGGEDMILDIILNKVVNGTYVDVGANDPYNASNTHFFYKKGWRGINIDALPGSMARFKKVRPYDKNFEHAVSNDNKELTYYMFESTSYNTFAIEERDRHLPFSKLIGNKKIKTKRLSEILDSCNVTTIDFMSVDVEGLDYDVLESNDWTKYKPKVILTEYFAKDIAAITQCKIFNLLKNKGYTFFCITPTNAFYLENDFLLNRFGI